MAPAYPIAIVQAALLLCVGAALGQTSSLFQANPFPVVAQSANPYHMIVADVTGDSYPDAIVGEAFVGPSSTVDVFAYPGAGTAVFGPPLISPIDVGIPSSWAFVLPIAAVDINGDGFLDVVAIKNSTSSGSYPHGCCALMNSGGGTFMAGPVGPPIPLVIATYTNFAAADLDNDGGADAVCAGLPTQTSTSHVIKVYSTSVPPLYAFTETYSQTLSHYVTSLTLYDINNDGRKDIIYERFIVGSPAEVVVLLRNASGGFAPEIVSTWPAQAGPVFGTYQVLVGDVNADGFGDVVGFGYGNPGPLPPGEIVTMLGNGNGSLSFAGLYVTSIPGGQIGPPTYGDAGLGDFDKDGQLELRVLGKILRLAPAYGGANTTPLDNSSLVGSIWVEHQADVDLDGDLDLVQAATAPLPSGQSQLRLGAAINRTVYGSGCGTGSVTMGVPAPGNPAFSMAVGGCPALAAAALGLSASEGFNPIGPCVVRLDLAPSQLILPSGSLGITTTDVNGSAQLTFSIPNTPGFLGTAYFFQWIVADQSGVISLLGTSYSLSESRRMLIW